MRPARIWGNSPGASCGSGTWMAPSPCCRALRRLLALPSSVFGPVLFCALRRFASICFAVAIFGLPLVKYLSTGRQEILAKKGVFSGNLACERCQVQDFQG